MIAQIILSIYVFVYGLIFRRLKIFKRCLKALSDKHHKFEVKNWAVLIRMAGYKRQKKPFPMKEKVFLLC